MRDTRIGAGRAYTIDAVDNALSILLMLRTRTGLRVTDVSDELGVARSTAHRLLSTLAQRGFVCQYPESRLYRVGPALLDIASLSSGYPALRRIARPHIARLAGELHETVHLNVLEGSDVRFLEGAESDQPVRVSLRVGTLIPAHSTSSGKVLLADRPREVVRALFEEGLPHVAEHTITDLTRFESELDEVQVRGYATNMEENEAGLNAVSVPVRTGAGATVAALVISAPSARLPARAVPRIVRAAQAAAAAITRQLG